MKDYNLINIPPQYGYHMGANRLLVEGARYYESIETFVNKYRGVSISYKKRLNIDGSFLCFVIIDSDMEGLKNTNPKYVKEKIDVAISKFLYGLNECVVYNFDMLDDDRIGTVDFTAFEYAFKRNVSPIEKRYIIKSLVAQGLPVETAFRYRHQLAL